MKQFNKQSKLFIPIQKKILSKDYRNPERSEVGDGGVEDLFTASHDGDGSSMFPELSGDLETDAGSASRDESNLAFEDIRLERRFHDHLHSVHARIREG